VAAIVLVAYYYPPLGGVGSQRALSFARHLPSCGYDVVVVTPERGAYGLDPSLPADGALPGVRVVRTGSFEPAVLARRLRGRRGDAAPAGAMVDGAGRGRVASIVRKALTASVYYPDHARGWIGAAARAARNAARESGAVAIVSTSPPVSGHVAALRAASAAGVPAILDFRDLWTAHRDASDQSSRARRERRLERELLRGAAAVTTVSENCRAWLVARHGAPAEATIRVLRNAHEEADFADAPPPRDPAVFRIVHAGTLYGAKQDTTAFFRALADVRTAGVFGGRRVEVVLAGKVDAHAVDAARAAGCEDALVMPGFVTHGEAIALMRGATVNLLLTWSEEGPVADGVCPGKMYEQIAARRPVLALALPTCEAASVLAGSGGALVADPRDERAIASALRRLADADRAGDALGAVPPWTGLAGRSSRKSVASELAALLASVAR
jgi:glycosyltransferase involved in cell wall biosynthesis